jgi:hypothetical protein
MTLPYWLFACGIRAPHSLATVSSPQCRRYPLTTGNLLVCPVTTLSIRSPQIGCLLAAVSLLSAQHTVRPLTCARYPLATGCLLAALSVRTPPRTVHSPQWPVCSPHRAGSTRQDITTPVCLPHVCPPVVLSIHQLLAHCLPCRLPWLAARCCVVHSIAGPVSLERRSSNEGVLLVRRRSDEEE